MRVARAGAGGRAAGGRRWRGTDRVGGRGAGRHLRRAVALGEAFQIADDLLNETSTAEQLGKAVGTDAAREKTTAVSVYGMAGAKKRLAELVAEALAALAGFPGDVAPLAALARHVAERKN